MTGACHCGGIAIALARHPDYANDCNCSLCTKSGAVWGYYPSADVEIEGGTGRYVRTDRERPSVRLHFCPTCGTATHWTPTDATSDRMGVNLRLFPPGALVGIEVRYPDGRNWSGEGDWGHYREPSTF